MLRLKIRKVAQEHGISLGQLQRESKLHLNTVRRYWRGNVRHVGLDQLEAIAHVLQVEVADLLEETDEQSDPEI